MNVKIREEEHQTVSINFPSSSYLQLQFPAGAFDCWAYMTCNEAIQAIMARLDADSLMSATSSLLLVRAELWRYALEKVSLVKQHSSLVVASSRCILLLAWAWYRVVTGTGCITTMIL